MSETSERAQVSLLYDKYDNGLNLVTACLFIVGEIAGTGILALPEALKLTGWFGVAGIFLVCIASAFCGVLLGECWLMLEERDTSLMKMKTRNPYPLIGDRVFGSPGKWLTITSQTIQLFGGSIISILLFAEISQRLMDLLSLHLTFCEWIVISGLIMLPFSFAGSPVDFWPIAIAAMSSTAVASIFIIIAILTENDLISAYESLIIDGDEEASSPSTRSFLLGLSTTVYAFCGAGAMPTIQNDMKNKRQFKSAIILAFSILFLIYIPVSVIGYIAFGDHVKSNVMRNLAPSLLVVVSDILIAVHVFSAYLILLNPVNLNVETALNINHSFNYVRCLSRTVVSILAVVIALSVPKFGQLLNLVGASAVCLQSFILPCSFYYRLRSTATLGVVDMANEEMDCNSCAKRPNEMESASTDYASISCKTLSPSGGLNVYVKVSLAIILVAAVITAISGSYYSLVDLLDPHAFMLPCFLCNTDRL